jgi:glucokinase
MLGLAHGLIEETGQHPLAIGVSFGGPVHAPTGLVRLSHHIPGWQNTPLVDWLQTEFNLPVAIDNDANAAALGELHFGAGRGCRHLIYVTVSTGIGSGWIVDGRLYSGADGLAGEIGHVQVECSQEALSCVCGRYGCLEAEASGLAIARRARLYLQKRKRQGKILHQLTNHTPANISAKLVSQAATAGDKLSQMVLQISAKQLGRGLSQAITLFNPEKVILGGGVTKSGDMWWQTVHQTSRQYALDITPVNIVPAGLGDDAPLWGAVVLAQEIL